MRLESVFQRLKEEAVSCAAKAVQTAAHGNDVHTLNRFPYSVYFFIPARLLLHLG